MRTHLAGRALPILLIICLGLSAPATTGSQTQAGADPSLVYPVADGPVRFDVNASTPQLLESAREMFMAKNYPVAEMLYKSVLVRESQNLSAMLELALLYETTGRLQYTRGLLTRASMIHPSDPEIISRLNSVIQKLSVELHENVDSLLAVGRYDLAVPKLSTLLTMQPENPELYYKRAQCHLALSRSEIALADVDRALALLRDERFFALRREIESMGVSQEITTLAARARVLLASGEPGAEKQALQPLARILELDPDHKWAREQFLSLTEPPRAQGARDSIGGPFWQRARGVMGVIAAAIVALLRILYDHLALLVTVFVIVLVLHSPLTHVLLRGFAPRRSLNGRLELFSIQEILTLINTHNGTGALDVTTPIGKARVFFQNGEIYHCQMGKETGPRPLQKLLKAARSGHFVFKEDAMTPERTVDAPLSLILMELPERSGQQTPEATPKKKQKSKMKTMLNSGG